MNRKALTLNLVRDGHYTPWGFRMSGGADVGTELTVQKVLFGSPCDKELQKGDVILCVGDKDARKMSHQKATELITKAGNNLKLVVARNTGPVVIAAAPGAPTTLYNLKTSQSTTGLSPMFTAQGNPILFKPLPKTEFHNDVGPHGMDAFLHQQYRANDNKSAITNQPYRSTPLITPDLKTTKDMPVGSYLRYSRDTSGRASTGSLGSRPDAFMLTKVQEAVLERAMSSPSKTSLSSSRTSTPEVGYQTILNRQYNSPINIYSTQSLVEALNSQTPDNAKPVSTLHRVQSPIQRVQSPTPGGVDICRSPTYQLIQEQEWQDLEKHKLMEHQPVVNRVCSTTEQPKAEFRAQETIHQSGSFKNLMANMKTIDAI